MVRHSGGCHCGRVRFEVTAPSRLSVLECNCSMCSKSGYLHLIVPKARFRLLQGGRAFNGREWESEYPQGRGALPDE